jgi:hypothetical protein
MNGNTSQIKSTRVDLCVVESRKRVAELAIMPGQRLAAAIG